jgi:hypothetical protein
MGTALLILRGLRGATVVGVGFARSEGCGVGEPGAWGVVTAGLRVSRPVLVDGCATRGSGALAQSVGQCRAGFVVRRPRAVGAQLGGKCPQVQADAGLDELRQDGHRRSCPVHAERLITGFHLGTWSNAQDLIRS